MIPTRPKPQYDPGARLKVVQHIRIGSRAWKTEVTGTVEREGIRPVGGMEMGGKSLYCHQPTLRLRLDDGEILVVALDDRTEVEILGAS